MNGCRTTPPIATFLLACFMALTALANQPAPEMPQYFPTCNSPQPSAPAQMAGGNVIPARSSIVWNGQDYGVVWVDSADSRLHFRRFFSDGTPAAPAVMASPRPSGLNIAPSLVWNGTGYGVAWQAFSSSSYQIYFARLNPDGSLIGAEVKVSFVGLPESANANDPALAWNGAGYAVSWAHYVVSSDIFATLLNPDGTIANGGASHDLVISNATNDKTKPSVAWSAGAGRYLIVWTDWRSGTHSEIYGATLLTGGGVSSNGLLVSGANNSDGAHVVDTGGILGLVWYDTRDGNTEIYFARLTGILAKVGPDVRLTNDPFSSYWPRIAWTGAEFGVIWQEARTGPWEAWFQRVSVDGVPLGGNQQVSHAGNGVYPDIAFGRYGYLVTWDIFPNAANQVQAWGCNTVTGPPTCAGGYVAYGITGTTASIGWLPSDDTAADIAYYNIYRNAALVGKTSSTYYNDSGLSLSTTYAYAIQPVNSYQYRNSSCTTLIYVKSNASLTLTMNKSAPDALLNWTDAGMASYSIFRGTDPRVMQQIGATPALAASDANALTGPVNYFYTVDDPGM